jgi:hypothetical protein
MWGSAAGINPHRVFRVATFVLSAAGLINSEVRDRSTAVSATNSRLLRQVQSGRMQDVQQALLVRATKWMVAGCTEQANRILAPLFAEGEDLSLHRFYLVALEIPWALTGKRPQHAPPPLRSLEDIERELWDHVFLFGRAADAYMDKLRGVELAQLAGHDLRLRAMDMAYDGARPGHIAESQKLAAASAAPDRYLASDKDPVTLLSRVLLAAQLGDVVGAREHLVKWAEHYRSYPRALVAARDAMFNFRNALMHRTVAAIALSGMLVRCLKSRQAHARRKPERLRRRLLSGSPSGNGWPMANSAGMNCCRGSVVQRL